MRISPSMGVTLPLSAKKQSQRNTDIGNSLQSNPMARPSANLLAARAGVRFTGHQKDIREFYILTKGYIRSMQPLKNVQEVCLKLDKLDLSAPAVSKDSKDLMKYMDKVVNLNECTCDENKRVFIDSASSDTGANPRTNEERFADTYENLVNALQAHLELKTAQKKLIDHFPDNHLEEGHETLEAEIKDLQNDLKMKPKKLEEKYYREAAPTERKIKNKRKMLALASAKNGDVALPPDEALSNIHSFLPLNF